MPPCMTTSVWPSDAIASAEANGSIVRSVPLLRLDDANSEARREQRDRRHEDGRETARQQAPRPARDGVVDVVRTGPLRFRRHVVGDSNASAPFTSSDQQFSHCSRVGWLVARSGLRVRFPRLNASRSSCVASEPRHVAVRRRADDDEGGARPMNIASRGATMAVDWEQRIDFARLRSDRLEKARASLRDSDARRAAALRPEQHPLRHEHAHRRVGARQERALRAAAARGRPGALGLRLGGEASPALRAVAARVELAGRRHLDARRDAARDRACRTRSPARIHRELAERGLAGEPLGIDLTDMETLYSLQRQGIETADAQPVMMRGARDQDGRRDRAARARGRDRRRRLRGDLPHAAPGRARARDRGAWPCSCCSSSAPSRSRRSTPSPATAATRTRTSSPTACCGPATRRSSTSSTRSWATGRATTARSTSAASRSSQLDAYKQCREWLDNAIELVRPGVTTDQIASVWPTAQELGFPDEQACFGLQFGHGLGVGLYEAPMISRVHSLEHPIEIEEGMVFALETYCAASDGESAARIEEEVVVTADGLPRDHEVPGRGAARLRQDVRARRRPARARRRRLSEHARGIEMGRVQDRVVIVTGGAGGIGAAACRAIAAEGGEGRRRRPRRGRGAGRRRCDRRERRQPPTSVGVDVTDRAQVRAMIQKAVDSVRRAQRDLQQRRDEPAARLHGRRRGELRVRSSASTPGA